MPPNPSVTWRRLAFTPLRATRQLIAELQAKADLYDSLASVTDDPRWAALAGALRDLASQLQRHAHG